MLRELRRLARLPSAELRLLAEALLLVATMRVALSVLPYSCLRRLLERVTAARPRRPRPGIYAPERVGGAVGHAARLVPRATCLVQALAARLLLARTGFVGSLHLGIARESAGAVAAHAWVESGGRWIVGAAGAECFTPLPSIAGPLGPRRAGIARRARPAAVAGR